MSEASPLAPGIGPRLKLNVARSAGRLDDLIATARHNSRETGAKPAVAGLSGDRSKRINDLDGREDSSKTREDPDSADFEFILANTASPDQSNTSTNPGAAAVALPAPVDIAPTSMHAANGDPLPAVPPSGFELGELTFVTEPNSDRARPAMQPVPEGQNTFRAALSAQTMDDVRDMLPLDKLIEQTGFEGTGSATDARSFWLLDGIGNDPASRLAYALQTPSGILNRIDPTSGKDAISESSMSLGEIGQHASETVGGRTVHTHMNTQSGNDWAGSREEPERAHQQTAKAHAASGAAATKDSGDADQTESIPLNVAAAMQVGDRILSDVADAIGGTSDTAMQKPQPFIGRVVRYLEITLEPARLGKVQVKLHLTGRDLRIELRASTAETARYLIEDQDVLNNSLRSAGLDLSDMSVSLIVPEAASGLSPDSLGSPQAPLATGTADGEVRPQSSTPGNGSGRGARDHMFRRNSNHDGAVTAQVDVDTNALYV